MNYLIKLLAAFAIYGIAFGQFNKYFLGLPTIYAVGIMLGTFFVGLVIANFVFKARKKDGEKYAYCFPDPMAAMMKKVDMRTQYEGSLLSMFFILIGMILFNIYLIAFTDFSWWFKGFTIFNSFWGMVFLSSSMVTTYQQYINYMQTMDVIEESRHMMPSPIPSVKGGK